MLVMKWRIGIVGKRVLFGVKYLEALILECCCLDAGLPSGVITDGGKVAPFLVAQPLHRHIAHDAETVNGWCSHIPALKHFCNSAEKKNDDNISRLRTSSILFV